MKMGRSFRSVALLRAVLCGTIIIGGAIGRLQLGEGGKLKSTPKLIYQNTKVTKTSIDRFLDFKFVWNKNGKWDHKYDTLYAGMLHSYGKSYLDITQAVKGKIKSVISAHPSGKVVLAHVHMKGSVNPVTKGHLSMFVEARQQLMRVYSKKYPGKIIHVVATAEANPNGFVEAKMNKKFGAAGAKPNTIPQRDRGVLINRCVRDMGNVPKDGWIPEIAIQKFLSFTYLSHFQVQAALNNTFGKKIHGGKVFSHIMNGADDIVSNPNKLDQTNAGYRMITVNRDDKIPAKDYSELLQPFEKLYGKGSKKELLATLYAKFPEQATSGLIVNYMMRQRKRNFPDNYGWLPGTMRADASENFDRFDEQNLYHIKLFPSATGEISSSAVRKSVMVLTKGLEKKEDVLKKAELKNAMDALSEAVYPAVFLYMLSKYSSDGMAKANLKWLQKFLPGK